MRKVVISFVCIGTLLSCGDSSKKESSEKAEKVLLAFNPEKGTEYNMQYSMMVHNDTTGDETKFTIDLLNTVTDNSEKGIDVTALFQNIEMKGKLKGIDVSLKAGDTASSIPEAQLVAAPVFAFQNHSVLFNFNKQFKKLGEKIVDADTIKALTGVESKAQFIAQFPNKEVGVNDTWESGIEIKIGEKKIEKAKFTVVEISETEIKLKVEGAIDGKGNKFGHEFTMKGDFTGEITVDKKTGWQNKSALHIHFILEMMGNKTPMTQEISYGLK